MSYLAVISLESAKTYLGVDDNSRDSEISRQIKAALSYLEKETNVHVLAKDKTYYYDSSGCLRVYDFPINTPSTGFDVKVKEGYSIYSDDEAESITLNIGHENVGNIDQDWIETGYALLECLFEGGSTAKLPETIKHMINAQKRFIL